ncbi:uncharacterized protein M6B38_407485 [Iris pallida]|uniref:FLZ-type domain-containing protein n=1 Tax=Iris pallida TaxID=29817 RepID=A0AAX6FP36_IRIPA|nr:uncharacterized protein M6B38_407485 [Iris pallida]
MLLRQPIIKLPDPISPGGRIQFPDTPSGGPESPLERNPLSPMGWKKRETEGVGLGIVAALERSDSRGPRAAAVAIAAAVAWPKAEHKHGWRRNDAGAATTIGARRPGERRGPFFCGSPPTERRGQRVLPVADFLSNCHLCRKSLHGKDIYMYRGEKAFCSTECRYQQIASDEFQEKCGSEARRPASDHMFSTSYTDERLFSTGIAAA